MVEKIIEIPKSLNNTAKTYYFLSELQNTIIDSEENCIILDFRNCKFSHAILTSFIGALTHIGGFFGKTIVYRTLSGSTLNTYFRRSGLYNYMMDDTTDYTNSYAIPFCKINMEDNTIIDYIGNILDLAPIKLTEQCHELLFKNIYEIFNNSADHSRSRQGVYSCGHWMPTKKQLVFSVYDTGIGIPSLIREKIDKNMSSYDAINWALQRGNSTKQLVHGIPRGLGLSDLHDFIRLNDGALNIFSNDIYFEYKGGSASAKTLDFPIIGTLIGITIKADYDHIYTTR